jgi:MFS family permease
MISGTRNEADVLVFEPIAPQFEARAEAQVLAAIATRQQFSPTDKKAIQMFGREEFRPVINGITIGLQVLLIFIGILTLGIGGVGVMNIMLVSVDERIREIGLRRALGARKWHIKAQFLAETLLIMLLGGAHRNRGLVRGCGRRRNASADGPAVRGRLRQSRHPPQNFILHRHDFDRGVAAGRRAERATDSGVPSRESRSRRGPALRMKFLGLMVAAIFAFFVLGFLFLYISSVFRFILFDSVLRRECSIGAGWGKWRRAGGRFFLWQIVFQIAVSLCLLVLVGVPLALALAAGWTRDLRAHAAPLIFGGILVLGLVLLFVLASVAVQVLAKDFLVPIMALEDLDFADGWHRLLAIMRPEKGSYAVYLLLKLVLSVAAGILFTMIAVVPVLVVVVSVVAAGLAGHAAGIGWSLMTISLAIISATVLLFLLLYLIALVCVPATVFFPAYAMYFLASRYPNLDAILNPRPDPILPPVPESAPPLPDPPASFEPPPSSPSPEPIG